jgi:tRNA 2-thiouridine synthesizing protein A
MPVDWFYAHKQNKIMTERYIEMKDTVDARGLSCPQPVLLTISQLKKTDSNQMEVLVDNDVSKENVCRAATSQGWIVDNVMEETDQYRIHVKRT